MFVRIHKTSNMPGIRNHKGSSAMLITYLRDKCMASEEYYDLSSTYKCNFLGADNKQ